jgi:hypothetical protein
MQYLREIFKGVTIDLAIRSYSVLILCLLYIIFAWMFAYLFSSPGQRPYGLLASVVVRPSVVHRKLPHLNLLLWKPWTKLIQTWQGWSLGGSLSKLCPTAPPFIQDGCCYKNVPFIKICLICIIGINRLKEKFHK